MNGRTGPELLGVPLTQKQLKECENRSPSKLALLREYATLIRKLETRIGRKFSPSYRGMLESVSKEQAIEDYVEQMMHCSESFIRRALEESRKCTH